MFSNVLSYSVLNTYRFYYFLLSCAFITNSMEVLNILTKNLKVMKNIVSFAID